MPRGSVLRKAGLHPLKPAKILISIRQRLVDQAEAKQADGYGIRDGGASKDKD